MRKNFYVVALLMAVIVPGCDESGGSSKAPADAPATNSAAAATTDGALPTGLRQASAPADAKEVATLKQTVKDGDKVVVRGVIAGRIDPIADNRAILTLLDTSIKTCDKTPDDGCKTPWDACCEPSEIRAKNSLTVQVVDAEGRPLKTSLSKIEGVKPLARLVVTGTARLSGDGVVIVNADGLHVLP